MNVALAAVALAVGAGAVIAVSVRDPRAAINGLAVVLVGCALLVDPLPSPATLGVRIIGALLVAAILRAKLPAALAGVESGSRFGWPAEALIATAASLAGVGIATGLAAAGSGGIEVGLAAPVTTSGVLMTATAAALVTLGATPAALGGSGARRAIGLVIVAQAALLAWAGLAGPPGDLEQIAIVGLLLACAATGTALAQTDEPPADSLEEAV